MYLTGQVHAWYDLEFFGAFRQVGPNSSFVKRASKIAEETRFHDDKRYQVGMFCETEEPLPYIFSSFVQLKSLKKRLEKTPRMKASYHPTNFKEAHIKTNRFSFAIHFQLSNTTKLCNHPPL